MTEEEKQEFPKYELYATDKCMVLWFNSYTNLVGIRSLSPLVVWWEKHRGRTLPE
ncbi:MAG: hypothetical protein JWR26_1742 [Pedosphaera sp.]|nr:hypothetical protein [Pedosphaera sp.]